LSAETNRRGTRVSCAVAPRRLFRGVLLAWFALPRAAHAEGGGPELSMDLRECDAAFADEVRRIAGIELHATVVGPESSRNVVTVTSVRCRGSQADLWVSDAATSKVSLRTVSLKRTSPRARARLIALAMAELVSSSWEEIETNPEPKVPAAVPPRPEVRAAVSRAIARPSRVDLDVLGDARVFAGGALLLGGKVEGTVRLVESLVLRVDAGAATGSQSRSLGDVQAQMVHGSLGLGGALDLGAVRAVPWAALCLGQARLSGDARSGATGLVESGVWAGPGAGVDLEFLPGAPVHASLGISGGGTFLGVRGNVAGESSVAVSGAWGALGLGFGISRH
jgi:hypothetical protein